MEIGKLIDNIENMVKNGIPSLPIQEVFTEKLMKEYTDFDNVDDFFEESGYIDNLEIVFENDFQDEEFEEFVKKNSKFDCFQEMIETFVSDMIEKKLFEEE